MSALRLRETFNRLLPNSFAKFLVKGTASLAVAASLVLPAVPAAAHHNENDDLDLRTSETAHSQDLRSIQDQFNRAVRDRRIILMDRDWLQINSAVNNFTDDQDLRDKYLTEYLLQRGRIHINESYFEKLTASQITSPHSSLFTINGDSGVSARVCLVYGGAGTEDAETAVREFIDVSRVIHGDALYETELMNIPTTEEFKRFITYHEIGHCMDDYYITEMSKSKNTREFLARYHRAESFADVYGALIMARDEGITDIADQIANIRLANMALAGPFQVRWGDPSGINYYGSYIYATHRSLEGAQDFIDQNGIAALQAMTYQDVAALASRIVDKNALNQKEADALMYLFANEHSMAVWDALKDQIPYVNDRHALALELREEMNRGLRGLMDIRHMPPNVNALDFIRFEGNPGQYFQEMRSRVDQSARDARTINLADELVRRAGPHATIDDLIAVFTVRKDAWRDTLDNGTEAQIEEARENLAVATQALWRAAQIVRGLDPDAANDNNRPAAPDHNIITPRQAP